MPAFYEGLASVLSGREEQQPSPPTKTSPLKLYHPDTPIDQTNPTALFLSVLPKDDLTEHPFNTAVL